MTFPFLIAHESGKGLVEASAPDGPEFLNRR